MTQYNRQTAIGFACLNVLCLIAVLIYIATRTDSNPGPQAPFFQKIYETNPADANELLRKAIVGEKTFVNKCQAVRTSRLEIILKPTERANVISLPTAVYTVDCGDDGRYLVEVQDPWASGVYMTSVAIPYKFISKQLKTPNAK